MSTTENTTHITLRELLNKLEAGTMGFNFHGHVLENDPNIADYIRIAVDNLTEFIHHTLELKQHILDQNVHEIKKHPDEYSHLYRKEIEQKQHEIDLWLDSCLVQFGSPVFSYLSEYENRSCLFKCDKCKETMDWVLIDANTLGLSVPPSQQLAGITDPTCKFALPIPVDINNPERPKIVIHNNVADMIRDAYRSSNMKPDPMLKQFLDEYPDGRGYEWQQNVYNELQDKPIELIEDWVEHGLPDGLWRTKTRAYLTSRKLDEH